MFILRTIEEIFQDGEESYCLDNEIGQEKWNQRHTQCLSLSSATIDSDLTYSHAIAKSQMLRIAYQV